MEPCHVTNDLHRHLGKLEHEDMIAEEVNKFVATEAPNIARVLLQGLPVLIRRFPARGNDEHNFSDALLQIWEDSDLNEQFDDAYRRLLLRGEGVIDIEALQTLIEIGQAAVNGYANKIAQDWAERELQ